jgi:hypothetical protein
MKCTKGRFNFCLSLIWKILMANFINCPVVYRYIYKPYFGLALGGLHKFFKCINLLELMHFVVLLFANQAHPPLLLRYYISF